MIIHVTQEDINNGTKGDCKVCPVALALFRATGMHWMVMASFAFPAGYTHGNIETASVVWGPNSPAFAFIRDFDAGQTVSPFEFDFDYAII